MSVNVQFKFTIEGAKRNFVDRPEVRQAIGDDATDAVKAVGAYMRKIASRSMRKSSNGKSSKPGKPPKAHSKPFLKRFLFSTFDVAKKVGVVGPAYLPTKGDTYQTGEGKTIPQMLEQGGVMVFRGQSASKDINGFWIPRHLRGPNPGDRVKVAARPYMVPAAKKAFAAKSLEKHFRFLKSP